VGAPPGGGRPTRSGRGSRSWWWRYPSAEEITEWITDLNVAVRNLTRALSEAADADLTDGTLDEIVQAVLRLRGAGLAHGDLGGDTIIVSDQGICIRHFRRASASAPASRLDRDLAAALGAMAVRAGAERTAAAATRVLEADTARGALVHLQRSALDPVTVAMRRAGAVEHLHRYIWANVKVIATEPRKIVYVLGGTTVSQLLSVLALGASLHAVGQHASTATLITVTTLAAIVGGAVPVPGGAGVIEAGMIAGLTSAGIPQDQAVAAVLIQRLFTAYLPPVWGWFTLAWMRRREYV
jgi:Lysylphosphatidylglycerol synthase TM region